MPDPKQDVLVMRLSRKDKEMLRQAAERQDMKISDWARRRLREAASKELLAIRSKKAGKVKSTTRS